MGEEPMRIHKPVPGVSSTRLTMENLQRYKKCHQKTTSLHVPLYIFCYHARARVIGCENMSAMTRALRPPLF